ncbi:hypothetical protein D3C83_103260 [compost metagenome]
MLRGSTPISMQAFVIVPVPPPRSSTRPGRPKSICRAMACARDFPLGRMAPTAAGRRTHCARNSIASGMSLSSNCFSAI